jgi:hypothetical protein
MPVIDVRVRKATLEHADELAPLLRHGDAEEARALGRDPLEALRSSVSRSHEAYAVFFEGEIAILCGTQPLQQTMLSAGRVGIAWFVTGRACDKHRKAFLRASRVIVDEMLRTYPCLWNFIDARYTAALRWARWLGLEVLPAEPHGALGMPFHPFIARRA